MVQITLFLLALLFLALTPPPALASLRPVRVRALTDASFEHDTQASTGQTTGRWFVLFASSDCLSAPATSSSASAIASPCPSLLSALKSAASVIDDQPGRLFVAAQVDVDANPKLRKRFGVGSAPMLKLFRDRSMFTFPLAGVSTSGGGRGRGIGEREGEESEGTDLAARLRVFAKSGFQSSPSEPVPLPPSAADGLKEMMRRVGAHYRQAMQHLAAHPVWLASLGGLVAVIFYSLARWLLGLSPRPARQQKRRVGAPPPLKKD